jgi:LPS O-antigen subunit length determinant protein (WzzB/FepE family)
MTWTNAMIDMVNDRMRAVDIRTAESSLEYLDKEMATANTVELRLAISQLIETQENNKMMANVQRDYAYHFIDRAVPPETKEGPLRTVISIGGAIVGFLLGTVIVVFRRRAANLPRAA